MCDQCDEAEVTINVRLASLQGMVSCLDIALRSINEVHQKLVLMRLTTNKEVYIPNDLMKPLKEVRAFIVIEIDALTYDHKVIHLNHASAQLREPDTGSRAAAI